MYMIRLRKLLQEFEYGELLWGDPAAPSSKKQYQQYIDRVYKGATEPDSPKEAQLWLQLHNYLLQGEKDALDMDMVAQLLALKPKFPAILDPGLTASDLVYRGMTMQVDELAELIQDPKITVTSAYQGDWFRLDPITRHIKSRSKGFVSVSLDWMVASWFTKSRSLTGRWAITASIPYKEIQRSALMNPDFLTAVGGYQEKEIWVLSQSIPVTVLHIDSPWRKGMIRSITREAIVIAEALESRGITVHNSK